MDEDIFINVSRKHLTKVNSRDILLVEAYGNYCRFITSKGTYLVTNSLPEIEAKLSPEAFCRIHRSYIVPLTRINDIEGDTVILDDKEILLTKQYKENLLSRLKIIR